jgi:rhamnose transport system permease protein
MSSAARKFEFNRDLGLGLLALSLAIGVSIAFPSFSTPANLAEVFDDTAILILLALGQMLVIVARGIDLSVAANLALSGMVAALFNRAFPEAGLAPALLLSVAVGTALGAINGALIWLLRLPSIVVTLGTMSVYRGCIYLLSKGTWVNSNQMSPAFLGLVREDWLGLTILCWLAILGMVACFLMFRYTDFGRNLLAVGANPAAATYIGIDAGRTQFAAFTICGALAGLCGYLWVARFAVAYTDIALGFELQVIAACLIGGVSMAGGIGTTVGVVLGCLFMGIIRNALPLVGISPFWQMGINGLVIVVAAILNARGESSAKRPTLREKSA